MPVEGRRGRKRTETRARIMQTAKALFLKNGFDATTIDEIAEIADISKRSFFDYFPTKEDVIVSWQDAFGDLLVEKVAERPEGEPLHRMVEAAMSQAIMESVSPEGVAIDKMVRDSTALRGYMHLKYVTLERRLAQALAARAVSQQPLDTLPVGKPALLAMVAVGALRLGSAAWTPSEDDNDLETYTGRVFDSLWNALGNMAGKD